MYSPCHSLPPSLQLSHLVQYRIKIKTEEKAKVVAAWGPELIQFLAALAILH